MRLTCFRSSRNKRWNGIETGTVLSRTREKQNSLVWEPVHCSRMRHCLASSRKHHRGSFRKASWVSDQRGQIGRTQCSDGRSRASARFAKRRSDLSPVDELSHSPKNGGGSEKLAHVASSGKLFAPSFFCWIWERPLIGCRLRLWSMWVKRLLRRSNWPKELKSNARVSSLAGAMNGLDWFSR